MPEFPVLKNVLRLHEILTAKYHERRPCILTANTTDDTTCILTARTTDDTTCIRCQGVGDATLR